MSTTSEPTLGSTTPKKIGKAHVAVRYTVNFDSGDQATKYQYTPERIGADKTVPGEGDPDDAIKRSRS